MVNIKKLMNKNNLLEIKVIPNSNRTELKEENDQLKLYLQAPPEKNKANTALIKFFKRDYHLNVKIKSGSKSRKKVLEILH
ncbi:MAG: DUF167 domain-containing protein [Nanoarchaeota archaeon]|nr:DUF167 domain-containing protein [Nanoarchaeota archaeon]MBU1632034.1 DUF167 domain-containing protein [Nanoarchaeota archaeon]MBU1875958.1 DUF167 domain-containing protein [Nanoarchaeota archaeon]